MAFQRFPAVAVKEEFRVIKTSSENTFISNLYIADRPVSSVPDRQKIRHKRAVLLSDGIVPLMVTHGSHHRRHGKIKKFFINAAIERRRILHQIIDFFQEIRIVPDLPPQLLCCLLQPRGNQGASFVLIRNDERLPHRFLICFR